MIKNTHIIIFQQLQPPSLSQIQISLSKHILQTFVVDEYINTNTIQVMPPNLQSINNSGSLQIMCRIVLLVNFELSRSISYDLTILHKNTTQSDSRSITVDYKPISTFR